jgi:FMN-dependent NADH-azoreductase
VKKILQINSSILGEQSASKILSDHTVNALRNEGDIKLTIRDCLNIPHLDEQSLIAFSGQGSNISESHKNLLDLSDEMISELIEADTVVIGVPMYNFGIPSQLKSFFDFICRVGITFKYTESGSVGLLENKKVYILNSRGGIYHSLGQDFITPYLKQIFQFIGITDLNFVYAEGLNMDNGVSKDKFIEDAKQQINKQISPLVSA